jgi:hypothetical protein
MATKTKKEQPIAGFQTLHVSLKLDLIRKIDDAAVRERRTRINMFEVLVERGLTKEGVTV